MFSWYTRPGPVSCQFLIPVSPIPDPGQQSRELLLPLDPRGAVGRSGADRGAAARRRSASGALRAGVQLPLDARARRPARHLARRRRRGLRQLAAEGYLALRQGARRVVAGRRAGARRRTGAPRPPRPACASTSAPARPTSHVPARAWLRSLRDALRDAPTPSSATATRAAPTALRGALAATSAACAASSPEPERVLVTQRLDAGRSRCSAACSRRAARGGSPSRTRASTTTAASSRAAGLSRAGAGRRATASASTRSPRRTPTRVLVTPAHQMPTGVVLAPERRAGAARLGASARALVIEDDYDAEYRYDRAPVGALQGLAPERVVYAGTREQDARARRCGSAGSSLPPRSSTRSRREDARRPRHAALEQLAFADFLDRGELDRHLRRMRARYRRRRDALVAALRRACPRRRSRGSPPGCTPSCGCRRGTTRQRSSRRPSAGACGSHARAVPRPAARGAADAAARLRTARRAGDRGRRRGARRGGRGRPRALITGRAALGVARQAVVRDRRPRRRRRRRTGGSSAGSRDRRRRRRSGPRTSRRPGCGSTCSSRTPSRRPWRSRPAAATPAAAPRPERMRSEPGCDARLDRGRRAGAALAARAVAPARADTSGSRHLEPDAAAVAAAGEREVARVGV